MDGITTLDWVLGRPTPPASPSPPIFALRVETAMAVKQAEWFIPEVQHFGADIIKRVGPLTGKMALEDGLLFATFSLELR
jgi:hypothetical protein